MLSERACVREDRKTASDAIVWGFFFLFVSYIFTLGPRHWLCCNFVFMWLARKQVMAYRFIFTQKVMFMVLYTSPYVYVTPRIMRLSKALRKKIKKGLMISRGVTLIKALWWKTLPPSGFMEGAIEDVLEWAWIIDKRHLFAPLADNTQIFHMSH